MTIDMCGAGMREGRMERVGGEARNGEKRESGWDKG